ncbi:uncharacterized protein LOC123208822 [Mangifera indica]|uniref:uncharacterized protein LOC123208822 n=1 Tax=Mangifera indica TaxID=29780 RepID=UPI001CFC36DF|nr:uncharacterized protein LOC123208822 [Mangifera indica]
MAKSLDFKSQFVLSKHFFVLNPVVETHIFFPKSNSAIRFPSFHSSVAFSRQNHLLKPITFAKRNKRRSRFQRSGKIMLQLISILVSNLNIIPQPLDIVIEEFSGGDGGGLGLLKGLGGGGFGWGRKRKTGNLGFLVILGLWGFLFLFYGGELKTDVFCGALGFGAFGFALIREFKRNAKALIFGLCSIGVLMGLGLRRELAMKWFDEFRSSPMISTLAKGKSKRRRTLSRGGR